MKKILIIDDDEEVCKLTKMILDKTGRYEAVFSTHAKEGIELARTLNPGLVLLDVLMPEMDGAEVATRLSEIESLKKVPIVFITAVAIPMVFLAALVENEELKQRVGQVGGHYFIQKPVTPNELVTRIEEVLNEPR